MTTLHPIFQAVIAAHQRIGRTHLERRPYWADEEPSEWEIRNAEKRHKDAFDAYELLDLVVTHSDAILSALKNGNGTAVGAIIKDAYNKHLDEMVEYAVYGRVLNAAAGSVA